MGLNFTKKLLYLNVLISILKLIYLNFKFTVYVCVCECRKCGQNWNVYGGQMFVLSLYLVYDRVP